VSAALVIPFDFALQRHVSVPDDRLDVVRRIRELGLQLGNDLAHDLRIGPLVDQRQPDLHVICNPLHAVDTRRIFLGLALLPPTARETRQRDHAVLDRHPDI
jgi:hypothetical protein